MKIPQPPPANWPDALRSALEKRPAALLSGGGELPSGYPHWDEIRYRKPPEELSAVEWWALIKLSRQGQRKLGLIDTAGLAFSYVTTDDTLRRLHLIDRKLSGQFGFREIGAINSDRARSQYVMRSLVEEAIMSSQLEGAVTTREQAKRMIHDARKPRDQGERMIYNNYLALQLVNARTDQPLTPALVQEIHATLTKDTLPETARPPFYREEGDGVAVYDAENRLMHRPPPAGEIEGRLEAMCAFANDRSNDTFTHPVLRAILLHFWLAYDHPFVDGNGRTARALFYWSMLRDDYWLTEYLSISHAIRRAPSRYARSFLYAESDDADATYFIDAQLGVIETALKDFEKYLEHRTASLKDTAAALRAVDGLNHRQVDLLAHALRHAHSSYTIESHRQFHGVTYQTARSDLLDLLEKNLLNRQKSGRAFRFSPGPRLEERIQALSKVNY